MDTTVRECLSRYREEVISQPKSKEKTKKDSADQLVSRQKSKYRKLENINREVTIETFGVFVGKTKNTLSVKKKGVKILSIPLNQVNTIDIKSRGITLSSDVIQYCVQHNISIFFSDSYGMPYCALQDLQFG